MNTEELARKVLSIIDKRGDDWPSMCEVKRLMEDQIPEKEFKFGDPVLVSNDKSQWDVSIFFDYAADYNNSIVYRVIRSGCNDIEAKVWKYCKLDPNIKTITMHKWFGGKLPCAKESMVLLRLNGGEYVTSIAQEANWGRSKAASRMINAYAVLE